MTYRPVLVPNFTNGLVTDEDPWNIPLDAFVEMENCHIHNRAVEKREGFSLLGKLVHGPATATDWDITAISQADPGVVTVNDTTGLSNSDRIIIHDVTGMTEVNGSEYIIANLAAGAPGTFELTDSDGNDVDTSGFTAYAGSGVVYLIPGNRVMGLHRYVDSSGGRILLGFDTIRASVYNATNERFQPLDTADIFDSGNTDYVTAANWASTSASTASTLYRLYFTNGKAVNGSLNGIRFYDASSASTSTFQPTINSGGATLNGCRFLFALRERLICLYTFEDARTYPQRMRWCQAQNPGSGSGSGEWDDDTPGKGGFVDAPTGDQIVSAVQIQDYIMVLMTDSIWYIAPTSDPALPFRWVKVNDFRSIGGKMAATGYDKQIVSLGPRGIIASNTTESHRIDTRIHDFVFNEINSEQFDKVVAARSYGKRRLWVLYPAEDSTEANAALVMDEETGAFSKYIISMNVLGYGSLTTDYTSEEFTEERFPPNPGQSGDPTSEYFDSETALSFSYSDDDDQLLGGDRSGIVYLMENTSSDFGSDIDMSIRTASFNVSEEEGASSRLGYVDLMVTTQKNTEVTVKFYKDTALTPYREQTINCLPNLNYISDIIDCEAKSPATDGVTITSPNHGIEDGDFVYIYGVEGMDEINDIEFQATLVDENTFDISVDASSFGTYTRGGGVYEREFYKTTTWKRAYAGGIGYQHQIQMDIEGGGKPFELHRMKWYVRKDGTRTLG